MFEVTQFWMDGEFVNGAVGGRHTLPGMTHDTEGSVPFCKEFTKFWVPTTFASNI